jgi:hypothetical protein
MSKGERRVRVTVTLSPRLVKMVDAKARLRPDKSRSATIETMLENSELERQVREYYAQPDATREADDVFWQEVQRASAALDAKAAAPRPKRGRR